jgi:AcrR family transcriptional regulator
LLAAAAQAIDEIGYEQLTTAMVAERAGASIGTVYRYFPDRIAVLQSLSVRTLNQFSVTMNATLNDPKLLSWPDAIDAVITQLVDAFTHVPGFRSLRFGDVIDVRPRETMHSGNGIVANQIAIILSTRFGLKDDDDLRFRLQCAIGMADALLSRGFSYNPKGDDRFIAETRAVVRSYLVTHYGDSARAS